VEPLWCADVDFFNTVSSVFISVVVSPSDLAWYGTEISLQYGYNMVLLLTAMPESAWNTSTRTQANGRSAVAWERPEKEPRKVYLLCQCGLPVPIEGERFLCSCGLELGQSMEGVAILPSRTDYWGEVPKGQMDQLLAAARRRGWRQAMCEVAPELTDNISSPQRAAFEDILPLPEGALILDIGAGLGGIAAQLSEHHCVVALEGVWERACFLARRKQQDRLHRLIVLNGDLSKTRFAPGQFDVVVVNGVLEWAALFDLSGPPEQVQARFLRDLRNLLAPGGSIYVGIENRFGWNQFRGAKDHSGLPYTSLMPRWLATRVCARSTSYRSERNLGYRTYTYGYHGYSQLFRQAGLTIASTWIAPQGYNLPSELIPLNCHAIDRYIRIRRWSLPVNWQITLRNWLKLQLAREWFWRCFGSDYVFVLQKCDA